MGRRASETERAVAEAAPLDTARAAAGGGTAAAAGVTRAEPLLSDLRRGGLLALLVLHLLRDGPSYGNQLMERITAVTGGLVGANPNTMYPLLRDLEGRALVAGEWEHPERRSRRFYRLTEAGDAERARLAAQLAPHLDAVAATVERLRAVVLAP